MFQTYKAVEVAKMLGISLDTFYRTREWRHEHDHLPRPISDRGPLRFEQSGMDAWFTRHHPARPRSIANDVFVAPAPASDEEHRARLAAAYRRPAA